MICTINQATTIDSALESRLHFTVYFPSLNEQQRLSIWRSSIENLRQYEDGAIDASEILIHLKDLASTEINGRQIQNTISTARQLASYSKELMSYQHLKAVIDEKRKFGDYISRTRTSTAHEAPGY